MYGGQRSLAFELTTARRGSKGVQLLSRDDYYQLSLSHIKCEFVSDQPFADI